MDEIILVKDNGILAGADGFVPQTTYCHYHENSPLSCKPKVKVLDSPFSGGDNQPPPENGNFDASQYKDKGGPNPFLDNFDYDNPNHTRENTDFSSQKRMNHAYGMGLTQQIMILLNNS